MKNYDEISGYNSERKSGGGLFKAVMTLSMAGGAFVYFKAAGYADFFAAGCGYVIIGLFCLLAAAGMLMTDTDSVQYMRAGTKVCAVLLPLTVNGGSAACGALLLRERYLWAAATAAAACLCFVVCAVILLQRYRHNEL